MSALTGKASGRAALVLLAVGTALVMLVSVFVSGATAAEPELVGPIEGDTCRALDYGVDAVEFIVPTGTRYKETFNVLDGVTVELEARPNRKYVEFTVDGATVNGGVIWNRIDQIEGNEYDYRPNGTTEGRLEPPPRDSGNEKKIVLCFDFRTDVAIDKVTAFGTGQEADSVSDYIPAGDDIVFEYRVSIPGEGPAESLTSVSVTDSDTNVTPTYASGDSNSNGLLDQGETWLYTSDTLTAADGEYTNRGSVSAVGVSSNRTVTDDDDSGYFGADPAIEIDKRTSGYETDPASPYVGPGDWPADDIFIDSGDGVLWTYTVKNKGNVELTSVTVTDSDDAVTPTYVSGDDDGDGKLDVGETWIYTATGTAEVSVAGEGYTNTGTARASAPAAGPVSDVDNSGYFGVNVDVAVMVTSNGVINNPGEVPIVTSDKVEWTVKVTNNSNVPLTTVVGTEDGSEPARSCTVDFDPDTPEIEPLPPDEMGECTFTGDDVTVGESQSASFTVSGNSPIGPIDPESFGPVTFYGGYECLESVIGGGSDLADSPYAGFWLGPLKVDTACAIPVLIETSNDQTASGGEQFVLLGAPDGFLWPGVTGVFTIVWDVEDPANGVLRRTFLRSLSGDPQDIPVCGGDVAVEVVKVENDFYYKLKDESAFYPQAVASGDTCLIRTETNTLTVDPDGPLELGAYSQTIEVYYIWNDPAFVRR